MINDSGHCAPSFKGQGACRPPRLLPRHFTFAAALVVLFTTSHPYGTKGIQLSFASASDVVELNQEFTGIGGEEAHNRFLEQVEEVAEEKDEHLDNIVNGGWQEDGKEKSRENSGDGKGESGDDVGSAGIRERAASYFTKVDSIRKYIHRGSMDHANDKPTDIKSDIPEHSNLAETKGRDESDGPSLEIDTDKVYTLSDGMSGLKKVSRSLRGKILKNKFASEGTMHTELKDITTKYLYNMKSIQKFYQAGDAEGGVAAIKRTIGNLDSVADIGKGVSTKGGHLDNPQTFALDDSSHFSLEDTPNSDLIRFIQPQIFDDVVEIAQSLVDLLEDTDPSLVPTQANNDDERFAFDSVPKKSENSSFKSPKHPFKVHDQSDFHQFRSKKSTENVFSSPKLDFLFHNEAVMARHELRLNALRSSGKCQKQCEPYNWKCTCGKLFTCVNAMGEYSLVTLLMGGFIDKSPSSDHFGNFTVSVDQLDLFELDAGDVGIRAKLARIQQKATLPVTNADRAKCNEVLEELFTTCDPSKVSCTNPNTEGFHLSVEQVCDVVKTPPKLLFEVIGDTFDGFLNENVVKPQPLSYDVCREFVSVFDRFYDSAPEGSPPNPMRKALSNGSTISLKDKVTAAIFQHTRFPISYWFNENEQTGVAQRDFTGRGYPPTYFSIENRASGKVLTVDCLHGARLRAIDPYEGIGYAMHFYLTENDAGKTFKRRGCPSLSLQVDDCHDGVVISQAYSAGLIGTQFRITGDGSIVSLLCPDLSISLVEDGTVHKVEDPSDMKITLKNPGSASHSSIRTTSITNATGAFVSDSQATLFHLKPYVYQEEKFFKVQRENWVGFNPAVDTPLVLAYKPQWTVQGRENSQWRISNACDWFQSGSQDVELRTDEEDERTDLFKMQLWSITDQGTIESTSLGCPGRAIGYSYVFGSDRAAQYSLKLSRSIPSNPNQHFVTSTDEAILRPAHGNSTQLWQFFTADPPFHYAVLPGFPGGDNLPSAQDKELSKSAMRACDASMSLLLGTEMSLDTLRDIVSKVEESIDNMPGKCCFDTPTTNADYFGLEYDPKRACQNQGLFHLGISEEACLNAGGKWFRSPCATLKKCIDDRPSRFSLNPIGGDCTTTLEQLSTDFVTASPNHAGFASVFESCDSFCRSLPDSANQAGMMVETESAGVSNCVCVYKRGFLPEEIPAHGTRPPPKFSLMNSDGLALGLSHKSTDCPVEITLEAQEYVENSLLQQFQLSYDGRMTSAKCPGRALTAHDSGNLRAVEPYLSQPYTLVSPYVLLTESSSLQCPDGRAVPQNECLAASLGVGTALSPRNELRAAQGGYGTLPCGCSLYEMGGEVYPYFNTRLESCGRDEYSRGMVCRQRPHCSDGAQVSEDQCKAAALEVGRHLNPNNELRTGEWNTLPCGCSLYELHGVTPYFNRASSCGINELSRGLVCRPSPKYELQHPSYILLTNSESSQCPDGQVVTQSECQKAALYVGRSLYPQNTLQVGEYNNIPCGCSLYEMGGQILPYFNTKVSSCGRNEWSRGLVCRPNSPPVNHCAKGKEVSEDTCKQAALDVGRAFNPMDELRVNEYATLPCGCSLYEMAGEVYPYFNRRVSSCGRNELSRGMVCKSKAQGYPQSQRWRFDTTRSSMVNIRHQNMVLSSTTNNAPGDSFFFFLQSKMTSLFVDIEGGRCNSGANINLQMNRDSSLSQIFYIDGNNKVISSSCPDFVIAPSDCTEGARLQLQPKNQQTQETFELVTDAVNVHCTSGKQVPEDQCKAAALDVGRHLNPNNELRSGEWDTLPCGCSLYELHGVTPYFNRASSCGINELSRGMVCRTAPKYMLQDPPGPSDHRCPLGTQVPEDECKAAALDVGRHLNPNNELRAAQGGYGTLPCGCSLYEMGGEVYPYFNRASSCGINEWSRGMVCRPAKKYELQHPSFALLTNSDSFQCPDGQEVSENECQAAGLQVAGDLNLENEFRVNSYPNLPCGCSIYEMGGKFYPYFNRRVSSCGRDKNSRGMVCRLNGPSGPHCPAGAQVPEDECKAAALDVGRHLNPNNELRSGEWSTLPCGCSLYELHGVTPYFNRASECGRNELSRGMVCYSATALQPTRDGWQFRDDGSIFSTKCQKFLGIGASLGAEFKAIELTEPFDNGATVYTNNTYGHAEYSGREVPEIGTAVVLTSSSNVPMSLLWQQKREHFDLVGPYFFVSNQNGFAIGVQGGECISGMSLQTQTYDASSLGQMFFIGYNGAIFNARCLGMTISTLGYCRQEPLKLRPYVTGEKGMKWDYTSEGYLRSAKCQGGTFVIGIAGNAEVGAGIELQTQSSSSVTQQWTRENTRSLNQDGLRGWNKEWTLNFVEKDYDSTAALSKYLSGSNTENIVCHRPNPAFSSSFEGYAKGLAINDPSKEDQCGHARKEIGFDRNHPFDVEVCKAFNELMCEALYTGSDHILESAAVPDPNFGQVEYVDVKYKNVEYQEEEFEMPPQYAGDPPLPFADVTMDVIEWDEAKDEESSWPGQGEPSMAYLGHYQDAWLMSKLLANTAQRLLMFVTETAKSTCAIIPDFITTLVPVPNPAYIACNVAVKIGWAVLVTAYINAAAVEEALYINFEKRTEGPDGAHYNNNASRKTYKNLKNLDLFLKKALEKTNTNMKNQHRDMRKHLQDRHFEIRTDIRRDIIEAQNDLGRGIVSAQNALGNGIVDAQNANGRLIVDARNAINANLCAIYEAHEGSCSRMIGPLHEEEAFLGLIPFEFHWPEGQLTMMEKLKQMELSTKGVRETVDNIEKALVLGIGHARGGELGGGVTSGARGHEVSGDDTLQNLLANGIEAEPIDMEDDMNDVVEGNMDVMNLKIDSIEVAMKEMESNIMKNQEDMEDKMRVIEGDVKAIEIKMDEMTKMMSQMMKLMAE